MLDGRGGEGGEDYASGGERSRAAPAPTGGKLAADMDDEIPF
jgi:hypothetical protein